MYTLNSFYAMKAKTNHLLKSPIFTTTKNCNIVYNYNFILKLGRISVEIIIKNNIIIILEPNSEYKIWVKAFTQKNEGEPSDAVLSRTDISGPSAPRILNLTCATQDTIYIQWERPKEYSNSIDYYYINYTSEHSNESIIMESSKEHLDSAVSYYFFHDYL